MAAGQGLKMAGFWLLLLLAPCIVQVAMAGLRDGIPRPPWFPHLPTTSYGPTPPCYQSGRVVDCDWYGWANMDYPSDGRTCLAFTRAILANTTHFPPGSLEPFGYYYLNIFVVNTTTNESLCVYGCFDMSGTDTPPISAPPPATVALPPPATSPVSTTPPPSALLPPPPTVLLAPPPATSSAPLPGAAAPATVTPPPPPPPSNMRMVIAGAGFLQPRGFVSFFISGVLLVLHGILGF